MRDATHRMLHRTGDQSDQSDRMVANDVDRIDVIEPCLQKLRARGMILSEPRSADTAFTAANLSGWDVVLAMYHDQGLPVLKTQGFGEAVNITLGLPFLRTSVDHGTALALAGSGKADVSSLQTALNLALNRM